MRTATILGLAVLLAGCGGSDPKKETTADEFLKQEKAKQAKKDGQKVAEAKPAEKKPEEKKPEEKFEPKPAAPPTPAPTEPDDGKPAAIPAAEVQNALALVRRGQYEQAINQAKQALRKNEKYAPAMVVMARAYFHLNKLEFAESVCDIALSIDSTAGDCHVIKGFVALKNENDPVAREQFEKATKAKPSLGAAWLNLGVQYLKVKNYSAAIPVLEKAVELMANRPESHLNLGSAYRGDNQLTKAQNSYLQALKLRPQYPAAYFNLGILFLDAQNFPGVPRLQALNTAVAHFQKYKQQMGPGLPKDDPADGYIKDAQKAYDREQKAIQREAQRKAREAAKKAAPAPAPAPKAAPAPAPAPKK